MSANDQNSMADAAVSAFASFTDRYQKSTEGATHDVVHKLMLMSPPFTDNPRILDHATGTGIVIEEIQTHNSSTSSGNDITIPVITDDAAQP